MKEVKKKRVQALFEKNMIVLINLKQVAVVIVVLIVFLFRVLLEL